MFRALNRLLRAVDDEPRPDQLRSLGERITVLERAETIRAAEHAAMVDQLDRLYKRVSARMARADATEKPEKPTSSASIDVLAMRRGAR